MDKDGKLSWWVPLRHQAEQAKREIPKLFSPAVLARIVLGCVLVFLAAAYLLPQRFPEVEFDWLFAFLKCLGVLAVILAMCCLIALVPPKVMVTAKGIAVLQGQHWKRYPYAELAELRIVDDAGPCPMLLLRSHSQREPRLYPISARIQVHELRVLIDEHNPAKRSVQPPAPG